jgi:DNA phosphorothioation-associated putative methyltransferase
MSAIGKRVYDELYVHLSALEALEDPEHRQRIEAALQLLPQGQRAAPNVAKLNVRTGRLSLLAYPKFSEEPFPQLSESWAFSPGPLASPHYRHYRDSLNPPILHRKELLVGLDHPERDDWCQLTKSAEDLGLFDDTATIGFKLNWERLISAKGYRLAGDALVPVGNVLQPDQDATLPETDGAILRHLTALSRSNLSAPIQLLLRNGLLPPGSTIFDYGCGRGDDIAALGANGYDARGWDPFFAPDRPLVQADVVNLGFVINVIEDIAERVDAINRAFRLARRVMSVGVMLYGSEPHGRPFRDGFITSRNTFQKYFSQTELKDYIEQVLHHDAFMAGPGIALVFADKDLEQRYSAERYRTRGIANRLLATRMTNARPAALPSSRLVGEPRRTKISQADVVMARIRPDLDRMWTTALDLGRLPEPDEIEVSESFTSHRGSFNQAVRLLRKHYDQTLLEAAARSRSDDVRLYMAMQQFCRRPAYRQLEPRLQRDIKEFFGDYRNAQTAGLRLLLDAADPTNLLIACQNAATQGLGWLDGNHSLQVHASLVDRLPVLLRAYVACGLIVWNAISEVQLVKIHIGSGKLTLLELDDFDTSPIPRLRRRIKVNVRTQDYEIFEYGTQEFPKPMLYRKSRYLHEDYPSYAEQLAFDEALESTGVLAESQFGPSAEKLEEELEARRLAIRGMKLSRSERIPDLDQKCGAHFKFRSFIECGETQERLGIGNLPANPDTYNALYDLATNILDPVIEYFGSIRLTYGFCSRELGRHISRRVAPKLDQHSAHETTHSGTLICARAGAACDFAIDYENMRDVADWVIANTPFDRLYFYGSDRPLHVSYSPIGARQAFIMKVSEKGHLIPTRYSHPRVGA